MFQLAPMFDVRCVHRPNSSENGMDYEVEGVVPRDRPKNRLHEVVEKDCRAQQLCKK